MDRWPKRYSTVPWLGAADLRPFGPPEQSVRSETAIAHVLRIPAPFGRDTEALIQITADQDSKVIAMAIVTAVGKSLPVDLREMQSNPRRRQDDDGA